MGRHTGLADRIGGMGGGELGIDIRSRVIGSHPKYHVLLTASDVLCYFE